MDINVGMKKLYWKKSETFAEMYHRSVLEEMVTWKVRDEETKQQIADQRKYLEDVRKAARSL